MHLLYVLCSWALFTIPTLLALPCDSHADDRSATVSRLAAPRGISDFLSKSLSAVLFLIRFYKSDIGMFNNSTTWWTTANSITTIAEFDLINGTLSKTVNVLYDRTFELAQLRAANFLNPWYDDEGWWALAWIQAYRDTKSLDFLSTSVSIFEDMKGGLSSKCGGGLYWDRKGTYVSAISNELFISVAATLANLIPDLKEYYLGYALQQTEWLLSSGLVKEDGTIMDGLDPKNCAIVTDVWTYNQGVILGGLVQLAQATGNQTWLVRANQIAKSAITVLAPGGVLTEFCDPDCEEDGNHQMFKGIFMRNLATLSLETDLVSADQFRNFITTNAEHVWTQARTPNGEFNPLWMAADSELTASYQSTQAGVDTMVAAAIASEAWKSYRSS